MSESEHLSMFDRSLWLDALRIGHAESQFRIMKFLLENVDLQLISEHGITADFRMRFGILYLVVEINETISRDRLGASYTHLKIWAERVKRWNKENSSFYCVLDEETLYWDLSKLKSEGMSYPVLAELVTGYITLLVKEHHNQITHTFDQVSTLANSDELARLAAAVLENSSHMFPLWLAVKILQNLRVKPMEIHSKLSSAREALKRGNGEVFFLDTQWAIDKDKIEYFMTR